MLSKTVSDKQITSDTKVAAFGTFVLAFIFDKKWNSRPSLAIEYAILTVPYKPVNKLPDKLNIGPIETIQNIQPTERKATG